MKYEPKLNEKKIYTLFTPVYSRKKTNRRGFRVWNFAEVCGISRGDQEKIMWNFQGSWFLVLKFSRDVTQFCTISRAGALFCLEFPGVKYINKKFQEGGSEKYVLNPHLPPTPVFVFF